jgi:galactokinase
MQVHGYAPGRVNLIGEHTDYSGGFVLPAALPFGTTVDLTPGPGRRARITSAQFPGAPLEFTLGEETPDHTWGDYVKGIVWAIGAGTIPNGFEAHVDSNVPLGSGLSSSAALLVSFARALREAFALDLDDVTIARIARRAEVEFVGAPVGIMDQMACSLADESAALFLDTRSLEFSRVPLPHDAALVVIDSGVQHAHATGEYKVRRAECERASAALGVKELRDVTIDDLDRINALPEPLNRRARHVVTENARVLETVEALRRADLATVGRLFVGSHASMRDDYQISVPAVDALVDTAIRTPGIFGARMTGGGFGGAIVAMAERDRAAEAARSIVETHTSAGISPARVLVPSTRLVRFPQ